MQAICVYCGSATGNHAAYAAEAAAVGRALAEAGYRMVYGGGRVGLMGTVANAAIEAGGKVTGVIPEALVARELAHDGLTELRVVSDMHERKALMMDLSDAFVALPGGAGTLEEIIEVMSWAQLSVHAKPFGVLNTRAYYDTLLSFLDRAVEEGFLQAGARKLLRVARTADELIDVLEVAGSAYERWGADPG
jgi:hypothetical protein